MRSRAIRFGIPGCLAVLAMLAVGVASAEAATIVALGASNTYGKGVARNQAYPAQLEAILRAKGSNVRVVNAGINGDTTEGMLGRGWSGRCRTARVPLSCSPVAMTGARAGLIARRIFKVA